LSWADLFLWQTRDVDPLVVIAFSHSQQATGAFRPERCRP
jgi:hypothetical protein